MSKKKNKHQLFDDDLQNMKPIPHSHNKPNIYLSPKTITQRVYTEFLLDYSKTIIIATGPAGTGKTMLACMAALKAFAEGDCNKIILSRPIVEVDEKLGFLPGTLEEKMDPWTKPIFDVFERYYSKKELINMLNNGKIEISPLAYMRGRSFHDAFIILDEAQNCSCSQMKMALTRISDNTRMVVTGDTDQTDRSYDNGLIDFLRRMEHMEHDSRIARVNFGREDIRRHPVVAEVLAIYGE